MKTNRQQRPFSMDDLFTIETPKLRINANTVTIYDYPKGHPYVVRTSQNNGIRGYIEFDEKYLNPANTISFGQDTATMFYQERRYFTGDKIKILTLKSDKLNYRTAAYLLASMRKAFSLFAWGQTEFNVNAIGKVNFYLPVLRESENKKNLNISDIDWDYMQERIRELEQERIRELELYLKATGLSSYILTEEDRATLEKARKLGKNSGGGVMRKFKLQDLFRAETGNVDLQQKDINGKGCFFINSGVDNIGIKGKTDRIAKIFPGNTITLDFWGNAYYRSFEYKLATHNHVFSLSGDVIKNEQVGLYLVTQMLFFKNLFSYNKMGTWNRFKDLNIYLPICVNSDGTPKIDPLGIYHSEGYIPDFDFMEKYICAMQKVVIADVVKYKDQVIEQTKIVAAESE